MWIAGFLAGLSTIIYPAISALVSRNADSEQQGVVLGILTGMRGLCNGLGPALFGLLFWLFNVNLSDNTLSVGQTETMKSFGELSADAIAARMRNMTVSIQPLEVSAVGWLLNLFHSLSLSLSFSSLSFYTQNQHFIGVPFLFGAFPVLLAILVACCIKDKGPLLSRKRSEDEHRPTSPPPSHISSPRELRHSVSSTNS